MNNRVLERVSLLREKQVRRNRKVRSMSHAMKAFVRSYNRKHRDA